MTATTGGIEAIGKPHEHVIRIRSDQQFDLKAMITSHLKAAPLVKKIRKILMPNFLTLAVFASGWIGLIHYVTLLMLACAPIFTFLQMHKSVTGMLPH